MNRRFLKVGAALALTAVLGAACGSSEDDPTPVAAEDTTAEDSTTTTHDSMDMGDDASGSAEGVETGASELRAGLTYLLDEHVYLAGAALSTAVANGGDLEQPAVKSAVETLDANSVALSEAVASLYGEAGGEQFLELWRKHIGFFVEYTLGGATGDTAKQEKARTDLDGYRTDFGAFLESATEGGLPADAVAEELIPHVDSVFATIDALVAGSPEVYPKLQEAAGHMPHTAMVLSGAFAKQFPEELDGDAEAPAAELRAGLTHLLTEHVYLAGLGINQAVADGGNLEAPATAAAVAALDANSVALSEAVASVYGDAGGEQFLELWRKHIGFFVDYTLGGATGDTAMQDKARADLDGYRTDFGAFLESATEGGLPADAVAKELEGHVETLFAAIDSVLAGSPDVFPNLQEAAGHMPGTALVLSGAIATQFPDKFAA